jgi:O-antigen/teichoic acid export membrane protein
VHLSEWPPLLRATVAFSLATAVGTLYVYMAQILTSLVASHYQSGLFAVSFRVFIVAAGLPGLVVGSALPVLSRAARDDRDRLAYVLQRIFEASLVGGVGFALTMAAGARFVVSVIAGPQYAGAVSVLEIQSFAMIASFVVAGWSFGLLSLHLHRSLVLTNLAALVVSFVLTLVLAGSHGARGAAIATVAGESTLAIATCYALSRGRSPYRPHLQVVGKVVLAGAIGAAAAFVPSMPSLARAGAMVAAYGTVILLTRALPAEFRELVPRRRGRD